MSSGLGELIRRVRSGRGPDSVGARVLAGGLAATVVAGGIVVGGWQGGHRPTEVRQVSGAAWLPSAQAGQLTLLDGSSAEVAAQVRVAPPGHRLDAVQHGSTAYAINRTAGTIARIDGATLELSPPAVPIPDAGDGLRAFADANSVYALDDTRGLLARTDPKTLASHGDLQTLAARVSPQTVVLDAGGRLWVLDTATGDLRWIGKGRTGSRRAVVRPGPAMLVLAGGAPVLVDLAGRTATPIDPDTGAPGAPTELDLRPDDKIQISGSAGDARLYVVVSRGVLSVCELAAASCGLAVPVGGAGSDLGIPVESSGLLFVPDYGTGRVWIVNLAERRVVAQPQIVPDPVRFQLLARDGVVFFNDPDSERAGVVRLDGTVVPVAKYDPKDPDRGVANPTTAPNPSDGAPLPPGEPQPPPPTATPPPAGGPPPGNPANPPPTGPRPSPAPGQPPPSTPGGPPPPSPKPPPELSIVVSTAHPAVGEVVALQVNGRSGPGPTTAHWTFGDGASADGVLTSHSWDRPQTYQVSVQATFADGQTAVTSLAIQVSAPASPDVSAQLTATRASYSGPCPPPAATAPSFRAVISVSFGPTTVRYRWRTSNGGSSDPDWKTITFSGTGAQSQPVTHAETSYLPGQTRTDWMAVDIDSPVSLQSNRVNFSTTCEDLSVTVQVSPIRSSYTGPCPPPASQAPAFRAVISVNFGPATVTYRWTTSNGGSSDPEWKTITFPGTGRQSQTVTHAETSYLPDQTINDWAAVLISAPVNGESNHVNYSTTCTSS